MRVLRWVAARVGSALLVVWLVATVVFFALRASGDPLEAILGGPGSQAGPDTVAAATRTYALDQPLIVQYVLQLGRIATLQLGDSYARKQPVAELIAAQLPSTLLLATLALLAAWVLALIGAIIATVVRGRAARFVSTVLRSVETIATVMPQFWLGAVLILLFAATWRVLPATSIGADPAGLVLPVITLAVPIAGFLARNPLGGQHHLCFEVPEIRAAKAWFEGQGCRVLGEPRIGAHGTPIFFVHPKDMGGVLTEIMETPKGAGH